MSITKTTRLGLAILLLSLSLAACAGPTPAAAPTTAATATVSATETAEPTETPYPTETVPVAPTGAATTAGTPGATTAAGTAATPAAGTTPAAPVAGGASGGAAADKYSYLGQSIADKTQLRPGRQVSITWTVKNSGTNGWTKDYMLRYFSGPKPDKDVYTFGKDVPAGGTINLIVTFTTPADPGDYDLWFKLTNSQMQNFGDLDFAFTVTNTPNNSPTKAAGAATAAPAPTATAAQ